MHEKAFLGFIVQNATSHPEKSSNIFLEGLLLSVSSRVSASELHRERKLVVITAPFIFSPITIIFYIMRPRDSSVDGKRESKRGLEQEIVCFKSSEDNT